MECTSETMGGATVVRLSGEVDIQTAAAFEEQFLPVIEQSANGNVILDLTGTGYMSSVGLRVIMKAAQAGKPLGVTLILAGANKDLSEIIHISRFDKIFPVHETLEAALESL